MTKLISQVLWQALSQQATHVINCKEHGVSCEEFTKAIHGATLEELEAIMSDRVIRAGMLSGSERDNKRDFSVIAAMTRRQFEALREALYGKGKN